MRQKRKELAIRTAALALICVFVAAAGRIMTGNRFEMTIPLGQTETMSSAEDILYQRNKSTEVLSCMI